MVAVPDAKKGEQLVLITGNDKAKREDLQAHCKTAGLSELMVPKTVLPVKQVPLLGTGKIDYVAVQALAQAGQGK